MIVDLTGSTSEGGVDGRCVSKERGLDLLGCMSGGERRLAGWNKEARGLMLAVTVTV